MPRLSVIFSMHKSQTSLRRCLDSAVQQPYSDVEMIAVDDDTSEAIGTILGEFAERDTRVRVVRTSENAGLGTARNTGLVHAVGDYVLFLDEGIELLPGSLAAIEQRLRETAEPDALYFEHTCEHWWRGPQRHPSTAMPPGTPDGPFPPAVLPALTGVRLPAWTAAYRREFLTAHGLSFPQGNFPDVGWGVRVVLAAAIVAVLREEVVRHLVRRRPGRPSEQDPEHVEVLAQIDLALADAAHAGARPERITSLFAGLMADAVAIAAGTTVPAHARRAYFRRAGRLYRRHRPAGHPPPDTRHRLLAAGLYTAFRALGTAERIVKRKAKPAARRLIRRFPWLLRHHDDAYAAALRRPIDDNLAVYCAYWGRGYACNPAAIHEAAKRLAPHIRSVFLVKPSAVDSLPRGLEYAVIGSRRYWEVLGTAKYLVNNANFENRVIKRPGTVHLQTQHGTPLKKMGVDQSTHPVVAAASGSFAALLRRVDRWDYNLSSNRHSTQMWERAYPGRWEALEYGYPRNDVYYSATADDVPRVRESLGIPEGKTAILYAPTHRDHDTGFDAPLDLDTFAEAIGEDFVVLLRAHYFYERARDRRRSDRIIDVTRHRSAEEVCLAADALITDYSSILFDYANLDRPIVMHAPDWDTYRDIRGVYLDLRESPPGPVTRTPAELARTFHEGLWADEASTRLRARFRERFCEFDDGRAAERVVRRVLLGESPQTIPPVRPLAERTPAPAAAPALCRRLY